MPEKRRVKGCGKSCIRCWANNLKHGNKLKKKQFPKQNVWYTKSELNDDSKKENIIVYEFSNIKEYIDNYIVIDPYQFKIVNKINLNIVYDDYKYWLSKNKKIKAVSFKKFKNECRKYIDNDHIKNEYLINVEKKVVE